MKKFYDKLVQTRHYLHQHPELSGQEFETTAFLKGYLEDLEIRILESNLKTGLVAEVGSGKPIIALRADIDALPILEQTGLPYASQNAGVMHACGHDFHQTSLLGAAELLKAMEGDLRGTVRLISSRLRKLLWEPVRYLRLVCWTMCLRLSAFTICPSLRRGSWHLKLDP